MMFDFDVLSLFSTRKKTKKSKKMNRQKSS